MGRRTVDGRATMHSSALEDGVEGNDMTYELFNGVTLIRGGTFERYLRDAKLSKKYGGSETHWFWVYTPTDYMITIQCDNCNKRHQPTNFGCSATLHRVSPMQDIDALYGFKSQQIVSTDFTETVMQDGTIQGVVVAFDTPPSSFR